MPRQNEPAFVVNAEFIPRMMALFAPDDTLALTCRSGGRSALAVNALAKAGFTSAYNIIDGFEGDKVAEEGSLYLGKRLKNGWKNSGLAVDVRRRSGSAVDRGRGMSGEESRSASHVDVQSEICPSTRRRTMTTDFRPGDHVPLDWSEFYYTNCPLVSASNVDQELGWVREELKKIGIEYKFLRSVRGNNWYPHYVHNMDNLIRVGGCFPAIQANADIRRTRLIGLTHVPHEGGCMLVRAQGRHLPDEGPQGQEDRPVQEPEHHQERLVALPGGAGHRAHAHAERHDPRRRRDRRVPLSR